MAKSRFSRRLVGLGTVLALGLGGAALAADASHVLNIALPDGEIAQVHYVGDVPPRVVLTPASTAVDPFAAMDAMVAQMARDQAAMLAEAAAIQRAALAQAGVDPQGNMVLVRNGSAGAPARGSYHMVSITTDARGCTERTEETSDGAGAAPKVVHTLSGNCGKAAPAPRLTAPAAPQPPTPPAQTAPLPANAT